jgi:glycosyltransferase involved in cell wall biosynthesis
MKNTSKKEALTVVHVASIRLTEETGMGRIAWNWRKAFEEKGYNFIHIGSEECPMGEQHIILWGKAARNYMNSQNIKADLIIAHEPSSGFFTDLGVPVVAFSHGIEKRGWAEEARYNYRNTTFKSLFMPDFIRFKASVKGLRDSDLVLLSNEEDKEYLINVLGRKPKGIAIFKNGFYEANIPKKNIPPQYTEKLPLTFLFNASWLERKGKTMMIQAFEEVHKSFPTNWTLILAGIGNHTEAILQEFPKHLHPNLEIIPSFTQAEETALYERSDIFILPSYFEGQSLALTQAMASGLCCICSDNCGQRDFIEHQKNGFLFKTGDVQDLARQIKTVIQNRDLVAQYAEHSKQRVAGYTWQNVSREVVELCEGILNKKPKTKSNQDENIGTLSV